MGVYLNPGKGSFKMSLNSPIFVDKSCLIEVTNRYIQTAQRFICVSRPRRFGKSMVADMLAAYYGKETDSSDLFCGLKISKASSYTTHLNQYDVIKINMQEFLSATHSVLEMLDRMNRFLIYDLTEYFYRDTISG